MVKKYLSNETQTEHTYAFYKERRNDPFWENDYLRIKAIRQRNIFIGLIFGLLAVSVFAFFMIQNDVANHNKKAENIADSMVKRKVVKNKDINNGEQEEKARKSTIDKSANENTSDHNQTSDSNNNYTDELMPVEMQGVWYEYDEYNKKTVKLVITKDTINNFKIHSMSEMTLEEKNFYTHSDDYSLKIPQVDEHKKWLWKTSETFKDGTKLIQINESGRVANDCDRYGVYLKNINGKQIPVLTILVGMDGDPEYAYKNEDLAIQMSDKDYSTY